MSKNEPLQVGPYENTRTTTIKVAAFDVTITTSDKSTHVPPAPCTCGGGGGTLEQMLGAFMQHVQAAQTARAQSDGTPDDDEPDPGPAQG